MNLQEFSYWFCKNTDILEKISSFYDYCKLEIMDSNYSMQEHLQYGMIKFDSLMNLKKQEQALYRVFDEEPALFSFLLEKIIPLEANPFIRYSSVIPEYRKTTLMDLSHSPMIARITNQLTNYKNDYANIEIEEQLLGSMDIKPYHFSHVVFQDSEIIQRLIKEEFLRVFLIHLQNNIDTRQIHLPNDVRELENLIALENHILIQHSILEEEWFEDCLAYEVPFLLTSVEDLLEMGANPNAISYFNEEFAKEQGKYAIASLMNASAIDLNLEVELLYLTSSIIQMRNPDSFIELQNFFTQNYSQQINLPYYSEKAAAVLDILHNQKQVKEDFCYKK